MENETTWGEGSGYILGQGGAGYLDLGPPRHRWVGGQRRRRAGEGEWTDRYIKKRFVNLNIYAGDRKEKCQGKGSGDQRKHSAEEINEEMNVQQNWEERK